MTVDLDAIAQRGRCEVSSLRLSLPLIEQGYAPPFLARYRRDELGGIDEGSLWALAHAVRADQDLRDYRDQLHAAWQKTPLADAAIGRAIGSAGSRRLLDRLARRIKVEAGESPGWLQQLAVRALNPQKGDGDDLNRLAASIRAESDGAKTEKTTADVAVEVGTADTDVTALDDDKLDTAIAKRLCGDPRIVSAAVRWLSRNAKIHVLTVHDPHIASEGDGEEDADTDTFIQAARPSKAVSDERFGVISEPDVLAPVAPQVDVSASGGLVGSSEEVVPSEVAALSDVPASSDLSEVDHLSAAADLTIQVNESPVVSPEQSTQSSEAPSATGTVVASKSGSSAKPKKKKKKETKKISPRQRRRRWLVSTLKPLAGKKMPAAKLSSFQVVMLGRALRSQVAACAFDYDPARLVDELQKTAANMNRSIGERLASIVLRHESTIRDASEAAWWEELQEQASARLVSIAADHLHDQMNRAGVEAKVVLSIDAVGPRTAAATIVAANGRVLHSEDIPCQLSAAMRTLAVTKMGELIHRFGIDLIVVSNGPARRACMIAIGELIKQSSEKSIRWTLADRSGADAYANGPAGDQEMRSTPRRFRAAAWIAFSALQPAQAMVKVDPLKLRLSSFQRELSDSAMLAALEDVMISGASRGGVDVNSATTAWLERLPGVTSAVARAIDDRRTKKLIASREDLMSAVEWPSSVHVRQAMPFLRVFGSSEVLDGTLVHPEDYPIAKKLATALSIELPPDRPPGYQLPDYSTPAPIVAEPLVQTPDEEEPIDIEALSESSNEVELETIDSSLSEAVDVTGVESTADGVDVQEQPLPNGDDLSEAPIVQDVVLETPVPNADVAPVHAPVRRPRPDQPKIDKLIKEWQIGRARANQVVDWICEPFGEGSVSGSSAAVMTDMPSLDKLKQGDAVIGVVVGVMPFGVFVELSPECSGLIHVSRVSAGFVEDLHEAVQVGDVVTAYVTGIDSKRRRVALSAVSPQVEEELRQRRAAAPARDGGGRGGRPPRSEGRGDGSGPQGQSQARGGNRPARDGVASSGGQGQGIGHVSGASRGTGERPRGGDSRGGEARGGRPGGRDGGNRPREAGSRGGRFESRGGGRGRQPEVYEVIGKEPEKTPITDAMASGDEPLRSFGDLMRLFNKDKEPTITPAPKAKKEKKPVNAPESATSIEASESVVESSSADLGEDLPT